MIENKAFLSLKKDFQPVIRDLMVHLEAKGWQPIVVEGLRTKAQQAEKVKQGNSQTMNSVHLSGYAADICDKREMWDKGLCRQFWMDMYDIIKTLHVSQGHLRAGLVWDHPERVDVYRHALENKNLSQRQKDSKITWFCDAAHVEWKR